MSDSDSEPDDRAQMIADKRREIIERRKRILAQKKGGAKKALTDIVGEQSEVVLSSSGEESLSGRVQVCPCSCDVSLLRGRGEERCRSEPLTPQIECPLYLSCEELM